MAICVQNLKTLLTACNQIEQKNNLLILGDANIFFTQPQLQQIANELNYPLISPLPEKLDCYSFGKALGFQKVETLDINGKTSIHFNLHDELPKTLQSRFDCVLDAGVLYWCFDPASAIKNIFRMTKANGVIIHSTALTGFFGRGYYNIHPRTFGDFYRTNLCTLIEMSTYTRETSKLNQLGKHIKGMGRIQRLLGIENSPVWTSDSSQVSSFVDSSKTDQLSFGHSLHNPEPSMIPNNVTGTFAFKKSTDLSPLLPNQTT